MPDQFAANAQLTAVALHIVLSLMMARPWVGVGAMGEDGEHLRNRARHYRRMTEGISDPRLIDALIELAEEYEARADLLDEQQDHGDGRDRPRKIDGGSR